MGKILQKRIKIFEFFVNFCDFQIFPVVGTRDKGLQRQEITKIVSINRIFPGP